MPLNIEFFHEKIQLFLKILKIFNFPKFWEKIEFSKKKIQTSNCSKKFAFWVMTKQKKLQRDFIMKITFAKKNKKNLARAHFRARRAPKTTLLWDFPKWYNFGPLEISSGARAEARPRRIFFEIRKVQIILHPLAIFGFFISLKLSVIEWFEKSPVFIPKPRIRVQKRSPLKKIC